MTGAVAAVQGVRWIATHVDVACESGDVDWCARWLLARGGGRPCGWAWIPPDGRAAKPAGGATERGCGDANSMTGQISGSGPGAVLTAPVSGCGACLPGGASAGTSCSYWWMSDLAGLRST